MRSHKHVTKLSKALNRAILNDGKLSGAISAQRFSTTDAKTKKPWTSAEVKILTKDGKATLRFPKGSLGQSAQDHQIIEVKADSPPLL
jgi:hypothetical protein